MVFRLRDQRSRPAQTEPEIRRVDLAGPALQLLSLGEKDLGGFPWLESPKSAALEQAVRLLDRLGATKDGAVTELGQRMARLPVHPRLGRFLIEGARLGAAEPVALAAALLSERDPFQSKGGRGGPTQSDLLDRIDALRRLDARGGNDPSLGEVNIAAARFLLRARDQFLRSLREELGQSADQSNDVDSEEMAVTRALLTAFPDRLARRRDGDPRRGVMVGGRGVRLMPQSGVLEGELFLCLDIDAGETESHVRMASAVPRDWIPANQLTSRNVVVFDEATERVVGRKRISFDDLLIEEGQAHVDMNEETARVLGEAAASRIDRVLPPPDSAAGGFLARLRWLREWMPELKLPAFDDVEMAEMVPWLCPGRKSFHELRQADWLGLISAPLTHGQRQTIDREAPERFTVPSGSSIGLVYELGKPPVLAVRIQEIFGMADTPRLAGGRVKLILHLLAPNNRPQQITDDLASFWKTTYPLVRKDLRVRYPKHAWPEDPWSEPPRRGPKRRVQ